MSGTIPPCRTVRVLTFHGDRSRRTARTIRLALASERKGRGAGPSVIDQLLLVGHAGVSFDLGLSIFGFHPDGSGLPVWKLVDHLRSGQALQGVVRGDTAVFAAADTRGLLVQSLDVILPDPQWRSFQLALDAERRNSQYSYGLPDGDGDCNCITWLERLGLPLLTGRLTEFTGLSGFVSLPRRRFGRCV